MSKANSCHNSRAFEQRKWQLIKENDWKCQVCGRTWQEVNKSLTIHHIDYDGMKNCIVVCSRCHHVITEYEKLLATMDN